MRQISDPVMLEIYMFLSLIKFPSYIDIIRWHSCKAIVQGEKEDTTSGLLKRSLRHSSLISRDVVAARANHSLKAKYPNLYPQPVRLKL